MTPWWKERSEKRCPIYNSRLRKNTPSMKLPCGHEFHLDAIIKWFKTGKDTCPMCRFSMIDYFDKFPNNQNKAQ